MNYQEPTLAYATRTRDGIVLNVVEQGSLRRIILPLPQAYHLMLTLVLAMERDIR